MENNEYFKIDSDEEQYIQGEPTTVLSKFKFFETIDGSITNSEVSDISKTSEMLNHSVTINQESFNGTENKNFDLVEKSDVENTANHIPRFTEDGHLQLPSGIEIW